MNEFHFKRNKMLAQKLIKSLENRNFEAFYCENKEECNKLIINLISKNETVSWGGSMTLDELGIKNILKQENYNLIDRDSAKTSQERDELVLKSLTSDIFLMSSNAISEDGEIVNIDKKGNRISALCFGPKKVIIVIGINKVVKTLDDAISRARNYAAPINAQRISSLYDMKTPCIQLGSCADCKKEDSICANILITRLSSPKKRVKVIVVNEDLGF